MRWHIELDLRCIKTTLGMEVLRCLSAAMVEKELWTYLLAYNLIRLLMAQVRPTPRHRAHCPSSTPCSSGALAPQAPTPANSLGKGIANIAVMIGSDGLIKPLVDLPRMAAKACDMLHRSLEAFLRQDVEAARAIPKEDVEVDALYEQIYRELITYIMADPKAIDQATRLTWVAHNLERVADRVGNICERIVFSITGHGEELDTSRWHSARRAARGRTAPPSAPSRHDRAKPD